MLVLKLLSPIYRFPKTILRERKHHHLSLMLSGD